MVYVHIPVFFHFYARKKCSRCKAEKRKKRSVLRDRGKKKKKIIGIFFIIKYREMFNAEDFFFFFFPFFVSSDK